MSWDHMTFLHDNNLMVSVTQRGKEKLKTETVCNYKFIFRKLLDLSPIGKFIIDSDTKFVVQYKIF